MEGGQWKEAIVGGCIIAWESCLWSQWDWLLFRNSVLCHKQENDIGDQTNNQIVLPIILHQTAFEAHHSQRTASHCGYVFSLIIIGRDLQFSSSWIGHQLPCLWTKENVGKETLCSFAAVHARGSHVADCDWHSSSTARNSTEEQVYTGG